MTVLLIAPMLLVSVSVVADAQVAPGASDAGVVPFVPESGTGGNVACTDLEALDGIAEADLRTSGRLDWIGSGFDAALPDGVTVTVTDGTFVAWSSTDLPLAAVIVKGSNAANVYDYTGLGDDVFADGGLSAPVNASGGPAGLSNLTICWDAGWTPPEEPDLELLCLRAAADAGITGITWVTDPIEVRSGTVDPMTVPDGFTITFDPVDELVAFVAPDPVAMVVTAASAPLTHPVVPPATGGTVPLSSNPGDGDVVLCGLASPPPPVEELSCDLVPDTVVIGPVSIRSGVVDPSDVPVGITSVEPDATSIGFTSTRPVAAVIVVASPPELIEFDPEVFEGSVDAEVDGEETIDLYFCVRSTSVDDPDDPADPDVPSDPDLLVAPDGRATGGLDDPTTIPTGGGPSGRSALALVAFVVLALTGSTTLLVRSRAAEGR